MVEYDWNDAKRAGNLAKHGVDFAEVHHFFWDVAIIRPDDRSDYGETRLSATAPLLGRLHVMIYVVRDDTIRIISLRKANKRERRRYEKEMANRTDQR
ncbi:BrnT family toxin [Jiella sonneratiae]|uniref:BrnT family toxin n=1 Tax=Jiella sonneratiae TaxID=2816856 RepID=A0ABS3J7B1_9HYPH|nr:BrnT family toxin [Jiella sonneratiae]MBO0905555.1 BrnT family toxin [Jiella sonneratiae]